MQRERKEGEVYSFGGVFRVATFANGICRFQEVYEAQQWVSYIANEILKVEVNNMIFKVDLLILWRIFYAISHLLEFL